MSKKKTDKKVKNSKKIMDSVSESPDLKKVIICITTVLIIFVLVYLLTVYITKNSTDSVVKKKFDNTTVQYDEILAGTSFSQKDKEYLVLFYNVSEDDDSSYYTLKSDYESKDDALPFYYVDLGNSLNKPIVSTEDNSEATKASDLKISKPTLIKIKDGELEDYIVGKDDIENYLK